MSFLVTAAIAGGVGVVGNVIGGVIQGNAANSAADKAAAAAREANALQERMYNQTRADQEPWRTAGANALSGLGSADFQRDFTMADYQKDPGYDFRMQEGQKALERSAAAKGGLQSGGTLKALSRYGQDYASNEYGKAYDRFNNDRTLRFNRLSTVAGMGQGANATNANAGQNYANQYGQNVTGAANAAGAADIAGANAWASGLNSIGKTVGDVYALGSIGKSGGSWLDKSTSSLNGNNFWGKNPYSG